MNLHVYALKRSGNNAIRQWITNGRLMAVCGNVRPEYISPEMGLFDDNGVKQPLPVPLTRAALRSHGPRSFRWMSRLPLPHYLGVEDRFVPMNEVAPGAIHHVVLVRHLHQGLASRIQRAQQVNRMAYPKEWNAEMERLLEVWVQHVDLLLKEPEGLTGIYFDRWLVDEEYRITIGQKLALPRPAERPEKRGTGGDGSSFEGATKASDISGLFARSERLDGDARLLWERCVSIPSVVEAVTRLEHWAGQSQWLKR